MRSFLLVTFCTVSLSLGIGVWAQQAKGPVPGDHMLVPPEMPPSPYLSAADIKATLDKMDPAKFDVPTGAAFNFPGKFNGEIRRRLDRPEYAIVHPNNVEYIFILRGGGTFVTGGTLIPPIIDSDIWPAPPGPNAIVRSLQGIKGGMERHVGAGDMLIDPPGTPHWWKHIDGSVDYIELHVLPSDIKLF